MNRLLTQQEICELTRISYPTLARWLTAGTFPQPINGRGKKLLWSQAVIEEWINNRQTAQKPEVDVTSSAKKLKRGDQEFRNRQEAAEKALVERHGFNRNAKGGQ